MKALLRHNRIVVADVKAKDLNKAMQIAMIMESGVGPVYRVEIDTKQRENCDEDAEESGE